MTQTPQLPPAGWYPDPAGEAGERFWDGLAWSQATRDASARASAGLGEDVRSAPRAGRVAARPPTAPGNDQRAPAQLPVHGRMVPVQGGYRLATFWWRVLGYLIDSVLLSVLGGLLTTDLRGRFASGLQVYLTRWLQSAQDPTASPPELPPGLMGDFWILTLVALILYCAYRCLTVGFMNATVGQKICGLKVAKLGDESLAPVGWSAALVRGIVGGVLYQFIGFLAQISVLFTDRKQTLPDLLSKTVVVNTREAV